MGQRHSRVHGRAEGGPSWGIPNRGVPPPLAAPGAPSPAAPSPSAPWDGAPAGEEGVGAEPAAPRGFEFLLSAPLGGETEARGRGAARGDPPDGQGTASAAPGRAPFGCGSPAPRAGSAVAGIPRTGGHADPDPTRPDPSPGIGTAGAALRPRPRETAVTKPPRSRDPRPHPLLLPLPAPAPTCTPRPAPPAQRDEAEQDEGPPAHRGRHPPSPRRARGSATGAGAEPGVEPEGWCRGWGWGRRQSPSRGVRGAVLPARCPHPARGIPSSHVQRSLIPRAVTLRPTGGAPSPPSPRCPTAAHPTPGLLRRPPPAGTAVRSSPDPGEGQRGCTPKTRNPRPEDPPGAALGSWPRGGGSSRAPHLIPTARTGADEGDGSHRCCN